jgi:hypothetical protein
MQLRIRGGNYFTCFSWLPQWHLLPQRPRPVSSPMTLPGGILLSGEM